MNLKEIIDSFIVNNEHVSKATAKTLAGFKDLKDPDKILLEFSDNIIKSKYNPALGISFTTFLQLANDKKLTDQFTLEDVRGLFNSLLNLQEYNLEVYAEAANFEWSVMDDSGKAKEIIIAGIARAKQRIQQLEELLTEINSG